MQNARLAVHASPIPSIPRLTRHRPARTIFRLMLPTLCAFSPLSLSLSPSAVIRGHVIIQQWQLPLPRRRGFFLFLLWPTLLSARRLSHHSKLEHAEQRLNMPIGILRAEPLITTLLSEPTVPNKNRCRSPMLIGFGYRVTSTICPSPASSPVTFRISCDGPSRVEDVPTQHCDTLPTDALPALTDPCTARTITIRDARAKQNPRPRPHSAPHVGYVSPVPFPF